MSFDLGIWRGDTKLSDAEAQEIYAQLCNDQCGSGSTESGINELYTELTGRYPEIDSVPEEEVDDCPWSVKINRSGHHLIVSVVWSRASEIQAFVLQLATKYDLILFDPQRGKILWPETPTKKRRFNLPG